MFSVKAMPSASSLFSAYGSMAASMMLVRSMANDLIPRPVRSYIISSLSYFLKSRSSELTLIIEEKHGITRNRVYESAVIYLRTKICPDTKRLRVSMSPKEKNLTIWLETGEKVIDSFEGVDLRWKFVREVKSYKDKSNDESQTRFELSFNKKFKEIVLDSYLPFIIEKAKSIQDSEKTLKMFTLNGFSGWKWDYINFEHPATFKTVAMEPAMKQAVMDDLQMFVKRKEYYKRVGKAWKRGYLLYGPPGTGKSSLIAAMANYLKFDIYDLQFSNVIRDMELRKLLLSTSNKSILVIEDIDCSIEIPTRGSYGEGRKQSDVQLTLSGLLNFIDGLWSSCGDERIIIFTTNHKEKLDPALLRPGRMDMHVHMSYCTYEGFKHLAQNYLGINDHHHLFEQIEGLLGNIKVTPAEIAEELMKSEDSEFVLQCLVNVLKRKKIEGDEKEEVKNEDSIQSKSTHEAKRQKIDKSLIPK